MGLDTFKDIAGLVDLLGIFSAIALILVGCVMYYSSSQFTGQRLMGAGGRVAVYTIIFIGVSAMFFTAIPAAQNQALWNVLLLFISIALTSVLFRAFRPKK